jgi:PPOX class probable F420-dependent enzyme
MGDAMSPPEQPSKHPHITERPKKQQRMTPAQLDAFLNESNPNTERTRLGIVASLMKDGCPHLTPIWYRWTGETVKIWSGEELLFVRNLIRDPKVAFSVMSDEEPCPAVVIRGRAEVVTGEFEEVREEVLKIATRYLPLTEAEVFASRWTERKTLITIHPDHVVSWTGAG